MLSITLAYHSFVFSTISHINRFMQCGYISLVCNAVLFKEELHKPHFKREIKDNSQIPHPPSIFNIENRYGNNLYNDYKDK